MQRVRDRVVYSPSDLMKCLKSPYGTWMERLLLERPDAATRDETGADTDMLARRGHEHEAAVLARLRAEGRSVVTIARKDPDPIKATVAALASDVDVVYQGALTDEVFLGSSDFLVRGAAGDWEVWDSKLSRSVKPSHVLQLCLYADLLRHATGRAGETLVVALGNGENESFRAADFHWYHLTVRDAFLALMARFDPDAPPPDPEPNADHGQWANEVQKWFEARDYLDEPRRVSAPCPLGATADRVGRAVVSGV